MLGNIGSLWIMRRFNSIVWPLCQVNLKHWSYSRGLHLHHGLTSADVCNIKPCVFLTVTQTAEMSPLLSAHYNIKHFAWVVRLYRFAFRFRPFWCENEGGPNLNLAYCKICVQTESHNGLAHLPMLLCLWFWISCWITKNSSYLFESTESNNNKQIMF